MSKQDTREEIEMDINCYRDGKNPDCLRVPIYRVRAWLNRQAAITERELCAKCEWPSLAAMPDLEQQERIAEQDRRIVEYAEQVDELTAERDQLSLDLEAEHALLCQFEADNEQMREALKAFELNQMYSLYKKACMDRGEWRSMYEALRYNKEKVWCDCDCCNWRDERERLTNEVETLKRANRIQAESFKKLELQAGKDG